MLNPWLNLPSGRPYILDIDREAIDRYNQSVGADKEIRDESIPEPFIGNPNTARVVLLGLNPGDSEDDRKAHKNEEFLEAMRRNLRHEAQEFAFYPLNPRFAWTGTAKWWKPRTRRLMDESGIDCATFAERLLVIEWFPYHSKKSALPARTICESQKYSFWLAEEMLERHRLVVGIRSRKHWIASEQRFGNEVQFLKNPQCSYLARGNMEGDLFDRIVKALRQ